MKTANIGDMLGLPNAEKWLTQVEEALTAGLCSTYGPLHEPMQRVATNCGKRIRPLLVLAVANVMSEGTGLDSSASRVLDAAVCVELVHVATLVHDDLIDCSVSRRGVPTINATEGPRRAVLVGDFILTQAVRLATFGGQAFVDTLTGAVLDVVNGQSMEIADLCNPLRRERDALDSIAGKTARLTSAACELGGHAVGAPAGTVAALGGFGHAFGMSFQLVDDLLDLLSTDQLLGKPTGLDLRAGVYTVPVIRARDRLRSQRFDRLLEASPWDPAAAEEVMTLVRSSGAIEDTLRLVHDYAQRAATQLEEATGGRPEAKQLADFPGHYVKWALDNFSA